MSLIYYARIHCYENIKDTLDVIYEGRPGKLEINFTGKKEFVSIESSSEKLPSHYINGRAFFKAIAGFGGKYEGWFSTDSSHVPLKAKMKVFIGSVELELESWKKWDINNR
ncbi:MAG: DUF3108 domain-containing protein, partial [Calditrichia bacterium]|nr:DUF3108 domain-containing protein [Calditrichia bacterium]